MFELARFKVRIFSVTTFIFSARYLLLAIKIKLKKIWPMKLQATYVILLNFEVLYISSQRM